MRTNVVPLPDGFWYRSSIHSCRSQTSRSSGRWADQAEQRSAQSSRLQPEGGHNRADQARIMNKPQWKEDVKKSKSNLSKIRDEGRAPTWMSPRLASRFTSYLMIKSPSIIVPSQPGHFLCCSIVGEKEMCAWHRDTVEPDLLIIYASLCQ